MNKFQNRYIVLIFALNRRSLRHFKMEKLLFSCISLFDVYIRYVVRLLAISQEETKLRMKVKSDDHHQKIEISL